MIFFNVFDIESQATLSEGTSLSRMFLDLVQYQQFSDAEKEVLEEKDYFKIWQRRFEELQSRLEYEIESNQLNTASQAVFVFTHELMINAYYLELTGDETLERVHNIYHIVNCETFAIYPFVEFDVPMGADDLIALTNNWNEHNRAHQIAPKSLGRIIGELRKAAVIGDNDDISYKSSANFNGTPVVVDMVPNFEV